MEKSELINHIKQYISKNKIEDAISIFKNYALESKQNNLENEIIFISKKYYEIKRKKILGLPFSQEKENLIIHSLLELTDSVNSDIPIKSKPNKSKLMTVFYINKISSLSEDKFGISVDRNISLTLLLTMILLGFTSGLILGLFVFVLLVIFNLQTLLEWMIVFSGGESNESEE